MKDDRWPGIVMDGATTKRLMAETEKGVRLESFVAVEKNEDLPSAVQEGIRE